MNNTLVSTNSLERYFGSFGNTSINSKEEVFLNLGTEYEILKRDGVNPKIFVKIRTSIIIRKLSC